MITLCCAALATSLARTAGGGGLYRQDPETLAVASHRSACDAPNTPSAAVWAVVTLNFTSSQRAPLDPFALGAGLEAQVATEDGRTRTTFRGYWDGGQSWRLRFAAPALATPAPAASRCSRARRRSKPRRRSGGTRR